MGATPVPDLRGLAVAALLAAGAVAAPGLAEPAGASSLDAVKAGFVYNFARFTQWPRGERPRETLTFCFERGSLAPDVYTAWTSKRIRDATVRTTRVSVQSDKLDPCNVLFVQGQGPPARHLLRRAEKNGMLLISDRVAFVEGGGHIALVRRKGQMRFIINLSALRRARLEISSRLLRLAYRVIRAADG